MRRDELVYYCQWLYGHVETKKKDSEMKVWMRSGLLLIVLLILVILFAQSRRNCEIPGSAWVPCIWGKALKHPPGAAP